MEGMCNVGWEAVAGAGRAETTEDTCEKVGLVETG